MEDLISKTVAFSGHRTDEAIDNFSYRDIFCEFNDKIMRCIFDLHERGYRYFITGGADGFDLIAARALMYMQRHMTPEIKIIAVIPHEEQSKNYDRAYQLQYQRLMCAANEVRYISKKYYDGVYLDRNKYMLIHSSVLVCYYNGKRGGTMHTVNRALRLGHEIINLCEGYEIEGSNQQPSLF